MKKIHWFHFILDEETIQALIDAGCLSHRKKVARFIVEIFEKFYWLVEKHHFSGPNRGCRDARISGSGVRRSLWLPLPEAFYQRLKSIHKDRDYYRASLKTPFLRCLNTRELLKTF